MQCSKTKRLLHSEHWQLWCNDSNPSIHLAVWWHHCMRTVTMVTCLQPARRRSGSHVTRHSAVHPKKKKVGRCKPSMECIYVWCVISEAALVAHFSGGVWGERTGQRESCLLLKITSGLLFRHWHESVVEIGKKQFPVLEKFWKNKWSQKVFEKWWRPEYLIIRHTCGSAACKRPWTAAHLDDLRPASGTTRHIPKSALAIIICRTSRGGSQVGA